MEKASDNEYKLLKERFHLYIKNIFYAENSHSLEQLPKEPGRAGAFQDVTGQVLHNLIKALWKTGLDDVLRSLPAWAVLWFSDYFWEMLVSFLFLFFLHFVWTDCCGTKTLGWGRQMWNQIHCLSHRSISELQKATSIPALGTGYVCGEWEISLNSLVVQRQRSLLNEHFLDQHLRYHHLLWKTVEIRSVESRDSQVLIWCSLGMPLVFSPDGDYARRLSNFQVMLEINWETALRCCGSLPVQKQSWRHCELYLLTSLQPTFSLHSALWICRFPAVPSLFSAFFLPALQRPAHCPPSLLPPPAAPPPHSCLRTYPHSPEIPLLPLWFLTASLSMKPCPSFFLAWSHRHTRELSRKSDLISLLSLLLVLVHLTGETRFAGMRRGLQRKSKFPNELCCLQALQFTWGERKGSWGVFLALSISLSFEF